MTPARKEATRPPIQKFNWWDGGINTDDQGKIFRYTVIPVLGSGSNDLKLQNSAAGKTSITVPKPLEGQVATYFNRGRRKFAKLQEAKQQTSQTADGLVG